MKRKWYFKFSRRIACSFMAVLIFVLYVISADVLYASTATPSDYVIHNPEAEEEAALSDGEIFNDSTQSFDDMETVIESGSYYIINAKSSLYLATSDDESKIPKLYADNAYS